MSAYDDEITLLSLDMAEGERSEHIVCPACQGGGSGEKSLLIWCDPGKVVARCYRVKCSFFTIVGDTAPRPVTTKPKRKRTDASKLRAVVPVPGDVQEYLHELFPWLQEGAFAANGVMWEDEQERVLIPITSLSGKSEGYIARKYPSMCLDNRNREGPKAKAWFWPDVEDPTCTLVPRQHITDTLVLAEDYWSALRISGQVPCIALSGTSIGTSAWASMMHRGILRVVMVFDADAVAKASKIVQDYGLLFKSISMVPLSGADPKDLDDSDFEALITQIKERLS